MKLASQQNANFAAAQARQHIEDIELLAVYQSASLTLEEARALFHAEIN